MDSAGHRTNLLSTACRACNVVYASKIALEQHYVESPEHPNCTRCHIGFADNVARQDVSPFQVLFSATLFNSHWPKHVVSVHHPIICDTCNGMPVFQEDVSHHYRISSKHPSCTVCDIGFENKEALDQVGEGS